MFRYKHSLLNRAMSSMLAFLLVMISVISPLNTVPTYATGSWINVSYYQNKNEDINITIISENESFEAEEDVSLKLYIRNNTEETLHNGGFSFTDSKEVFSEAGFVLSDETEVYIGEKGNLAGITLAPGEVLEAEFAGTIKDSAKLEGNRTLGFFFGAYDSNENPVTRRVMFDYVTGYMTFLPVEFEDGAEIAAGESGTMTFRLSMDQSAHTFEEEESYIVATDSDAGVATDSNAAIATDSNAAIETDSNAAIATDSNAAIATDSDADEEEGEKRVSISHVNFAIETSDMAFENVKLIEAKQIQTINGTFEVEATVGFTVGAETEIGTHYGNVNATVKVGKKTYELSQGFELEISGFTKAELEAVQNVIDLIAKLPTMEEYLAAMGQFFPEDGTEDEAGYEAYIRELTKLAVAAYEAYEALSDELKALIDPAYVQKLELIHGLCDPTTLVGEQTDYGDKYILLNCRSKSGAVGKLKIYCVEDLGENEEGDRILYNLLNNVTPEKEYVSEKGLVATLEEIYDNTETESIGENVETFLYSLVEDPSNKNDVSYNYLKRSEFIAGTEKVENTVKISYNPEGGNGMRWHYTAPSTWEHMGGTADATEANLILYFDAETREPEPKLLEVLPNSTTLNATVQMFDYDAGINGREGINEQGLGLNDYHFYAWDKVSQIKDKYLYSILEGKDEEGKDIIADVSSDYRSAPFGSLVPMGPTLGEDGYPVVNLGTETEPDYHSLAYLFNQKDKNSMQDPIAGKVVYPKMTDGGGLFQLDPRTGYYEYDSAKNAAYYNGEEFTLYKGVLRPAHINSKNQLDDLDENSTADEINEYRRIVGTRESNFLPFNEPWVDLSGGHKLDEYTVDTAIQVAVEEIDGEETIKPTGGKETMSPTSYPLDWYNSVPGEKDTRTDYWFGMTLEFEFMMPKNGKVPIKDDAGNIIGDQDMIFEFNGDDDVWVYIDNQLVLDIGACHEDRRGYINFADGTVVDPTVDDDRKALRSIFTTSDGEPLTELNGNTFSDYSVHKLKFFYMERGGSYSYCKIKFNMPLLKQNSISVKKELTVENNATSQSELLGKKNFAFQVFKADSSGNKTSDLFIGAYTPYNLYDENEKQVSGEFKTDKDGIFTLQPGYRAEFTEISEDRGKYYVRELLDPTEFKQYGGITVSGESTTNAGNITIDSAEFIGVDSPVKDASDGASHFLFNNMVTFNDLGKLRISKTLKFYADENVSSNQEFNFQVKLNETLLPEGTKYTVAGATKTVLKAGEVIVPAESSAVISNIFLGTTFKVEETEESSKDYSVTYTLNGEKVNSTSVEGIITKEGQIVKVEATNKENGAVVHIPIKKTLTNGDGKTHTYTVQLVQVDENGNTLSNVEPLTHTITISGNGECSEYGDEFTLTYLSTDPNIKDGDEFFYKITEVVDNSLLDTVAFDSTSYIVKVTISKGQNTFDATTTWYKNGEELTGEGAKEAEFRNTLLGTIRIEKKMDGTTDNPNKVFDFKITLRSGILPTVDSGNVGGTHSGYELKDGAASIKLSAGQYIELKKIPLGTMVTVEEIEADGYEVSWNAGVIVDAENSAAATATVNSDVANNILNFICTNKDIKGDLVLTKLVDNTANPEATGGEFQFKVTLESGNAAEYDYKLTKADGTKYTGKVKFAVSDGKLMSDVIEISHNDRYEIIGLPSGVKATVTELTTDGYFVSWSDGDTVAGVDIAALENDMTSAEGTIRNDNALVFSCTNKPGTILPSTGGNGTLPYRMNGLLMMLMAAGYLLISEKKLRRKEEEISV